MVLTGLPWGYPRATWAHILSIHRFLQIRLNKDPVGHIELCIKHHAKTHRMSFLVEHTPQPECSMNVE